MSHWTLTLPAPIAKWPGLSRGTLLGLPDGVTDGRRLPSVVTDAQRHKFSLLLAIAGTLMMSALALDRIHRNTAVFDMPAFKASKPPLHDLTIEPTRGPRV
jgi:hypothetical protein